MKFINLADIDLMELLGLDDTAKGLVRRGKLFAFERLFGNQWFSDLFGVIQLSDYSKAVTVSPYGIVSIIKDYLYRANDLSTILGDELGSEFIGEMLSEGLSVAFETNLAGSLQSILNVWKGSLPPDLSYAVELGRRLDRVETLYALSQLAPIGHSPMAILEALVSGADNRLREKLSTAKETYLQFLTAKNSGLTEHLTQFTNFIAEVINQLVYGAIVLLDKIDGLIKEVANEHLSRINQLEDDLEANKLRYDSGIIDKEQFELRLKEIEIDVDSTIAIYDEWISEIENLVNEYANWLSDKKDEIVNLILNYLSALESAYNSVLNEIAYRIRNVADDSDLKNKVLDLYERIKAYRKSGFKYS